MERSLPEMLPSPPGFPSGRAQLFVAGQVSETLIRLGCDGQVLPGLATSWEPDATGRRWTFTLRPGARFADGTPVTAADVARSFREVSTTQPWLDREGALVAWAGVRSAVVRGDSAIVLEFDHPAMAVPTALVHPALVTVSRTAGTPVASGPFAIQVAAGARMRLTAGERGSLDLTVMDGDPRDALDAGQDLVITRDRRTLAYAGGLDDYRTVPLAWSDLYVLVRPRIADPMPAVDRDGLALLVPMSARAAPSLPSWWDGLATCPAPATRRAPARQGTARLVYQAADPVAQALAERLVALASLDLRATGRTAEEFRGDIAAAADWGYLIRLPAVPLAPCLVVAEWGAAAPWLSFVPPFNGFEPLVETRWHAVAVPARVAGRVSIDGTGTPIVHPGP